MTTAKQIAHRAAQALDAKKGQDIKLLRVTDVTTLADYFLICTGTSNTHVKTLCDEVEKVMTEAAGRAAPAAGKATAAAPGCCWTLAAWLSTSLPTTPENSTTWSACGVTPSKSR